jgi:hypothetical protein
LESALMQQLSKYPILAVTGVLPLKTRYQRLAEKVKRRNFHTLYSVPPVNHNLSRATNQTRHEQ